jgi:hypothetical protein
MALTAQQFVQQMLPYSGGNTTKAAKTVADMLPYSLQGQNQGAANASGGDTSYDNGYAGGGASSGGGGGTSPAYDPATLALFDNQIGQINSGLGRLDNQQNIGLSNAQNAYNSAYNKLLADKAVAQRNYDTTKVQNTQDNVAAKSNIDLGVGRLANSTQRLLGSHGDGNSSAAQIQAPYAAALQGTQQRGQVGQTFARNEQALDTNWQDYGRNVENGIGDLGNQLYSNQNKVKASVEGNRASLLSSLAQLMSQRTAAAGGSTAAALAAAQPYMAQAQGSLTNVDNLGNEFANPVMQAQNIRYAAPDLAQYNYDQAQGPQLENSSALTDTISPYLSLLLGGKRQNNQIQY